LVREPDRPKENFVVPETVKESLLLSPSVVFPYTSKVPETTAVPPKTDLDASDPETKNTASVPAVGNLASGALPIITLPVIPILEELLADPDILFVTRAMVFDSC
jgi:hypothetical protein